MTLVSILYTPETDRTILERPSSMATTNSYTFTIRLNSRELIRIRVFGDTGLRGVLHQALSWSQQRIFLIEQRKSQQDHSSPVKDVVESLKEV